MLAPLRKSPLSLGVHVVAESDLLFVIQAARLQGLGAGAGQRRQQKAGKNRNDRDHDQEFDERECGTEARNLRFHKKSGSGFNSIVEAKQRVSKGNSPRALERTASQFLSRR